MGSTTATLVGGVYPNGLDTTYHWEYGTSTAYGHQTTAQDVGSGAAPVTAQASLSGLTPGVTYHYRLVATNSDGTDYGYDYTMATPTVSTIAPVNTVGPVLSGQSVQGQTLTASTGTWSPTPTSYTYQWQRSTDGGTTWVNIAGAITSSYAVAGSDLGAQIRVVVSATNSYGTSAAGTTPVTIGSGAPAATTGPTVTGHANQGQILSATSTWNPSGASYSYQWQNSTDNGSTWTNIGGASSSTYTLAASDLGDLVRVAVTAVNGFGTTTASSAGVGPVLNNAPINSAVPTLTGTAQRTGGAHHHRRHMDGAGEHHHLPVAAVGRRERVVEHRGRHLLHLHRPVRRRRRPGPRAGHRHQPLGCDEQPHRANPDHCALPAGQHRAPRRSRGSPSAV